MSANDNTPFKIPGTKNNDQVPPIPPSEKVGTATNAQTVKELENQGTTKPEEEDEEETTSEEDDDDDEDEEESPTAISKDKEVVKKDSDHLVVLKEANNEQHKNGSSDEEIDDEEMKARNKAKRNSGNKDNGDAENAMQKERFKVEHFLRKNPSFLEDYVVCNVNEATIHCWLEKKACKGGQSQNHKGPNPQPTAAAALVREPQR